MINLNSIREHLTDLDGRDYGAYQSLKGAYTAEFFDLYVDQIPKDPYAPSFTGIYRARISPSYCYVPSDLEADSPGEIAYCDYLARRFYEVSSNSTSPRGTGNSGLITIDQPGQAILKRNSIIVTDDYIEVRFFIGLPADGRNINGKVAQVMVFEELPAIIEGAFSRKNIDSEQCLLHLETAETAVFLRNQLKKHKLACFIGEQSLLPRKSGTSDKPLDKAEAVLFQSPPSLEITLDLPHGGSVKGMGLPEGITLITGGGYHGKSTLLNAIAAGVYNHIPNDGRERVISNENSLKIRSYSGRFVEKVNISPFISNLPSESDTTLFSTENASGSTSQAAALMEGLEAGAEVLLMDEDTCASNFMLRDEKMQKLVQKADEPITPFIDRARELYKEKNVSTILVLGGSGDYFEISDKVIQMKNYMPEDVTEKALNIAGLYKNGRKKEMVEYDFHTSGRIPLGGSIDPYNAYHKKSVYAKDIHRINFGRYVIDLTDVEQILELSQTKAIMEALQQIEGGIDGKKTLKEILNILELRLLEAGLDILSERISGNLAEFRMIELACAVNRLRSLKIS